MRRQLPSWLTATHTAAAGQTANVLAASQSLYPSKDGAAEKINDRWAIHDLWPWRVYQASINNTYRALLYADTDQKVYLNWGNEEYIVNDSGIETHLWWKHLKLVQTNKTLEIWNEERLLIDVNRLEAAYVYLNDDPTECLIAWTDPVNLAWKNIQWVWTNKSPNEQKLMDMDTLQTVSLHIKGNSQESIKLWRFKLEYNLGWMRILVVLVNDKRCFINADTLEKVTVKNNPTANLTAMQLDCGSIRNFALPLGWKIAAEFEINNDEEQHRVLFVDTLEQVTLKDSPNDIITTYTSHTRAKNDSEPYKVLIWESRVWFATIGSDKSPVPIYPDTLEKVSLEGFPEKIITWLQMGDSSFRTRRIDHNDGSVSFGGATYIPLTITFNKTKTVQLEIEMNDSRSYQTIQIQPEAIVEAYLAD
jgi:hypothetical protein